MLLGAAMRHGGGAGSVARRLVGPGNHDRCVRASTTTYRSAASSRSFIDRRRQRPGAHLHGRERSGTFPWRMDLARRLQRDAHVHARHALLHDRGREGRQRAKCCPPAIACAAATSRCILPTAKGAIELHDMIVFLVQATDGKHAIADPGRLALAGDAIEGSRRQGVTIRAIAERRARRCCRSSRS